MSDLETKYQELLDLPKAVTLDPEPYQAPTPEVIAACALNDEEVAAAVETHRAKIMQGVTVVENGKPVLNVIAGMPAAWKSAAHERLVSGLVNGVMVVDLDACRGFAHGAAEFTRLHPMAADEIAGTAGKIRDTIRDEAWASGVNVVLPGAFKTTATMQKIVKTAAGAGYAVNFNYIAGDPDFNRVMTERRYVELLLAAQEDSTVIVRNVDEKGYAPIAVGSPVVVNDLDRDFTALGLAELRIFDRWGRTLYTKTPGDTKQQALDVIKIENERPFNSDEKRTLAETLDLFITAAQCGLLREEDVTRIAERAAPVMAKLARDKGLVVDVATGELCRSPAKGVEPGISG